MVMSEQWTEKGIKNSRVSDLLGYQTRTSVGGFGLGREQWDLMWITPLASFGESNQQ